MFEVLRKFAHRHKDARKKTLRENAKGILKRDHLMAQMQADQDKLDVSSTPVAPPAESAPTAIAPPPPAEAHVPHQRSRKKKPAKPIHATPLAAAFQFMAEIDLDLKGLPAPTSAPTEPAGLPPDFSAKLQELRRLMDF